MMIKNDNAPFFLKAIIEKKRKNNSKRLIKSPRWKFPKNIQRTYTRALLNMVGFWENSAKELIIPRIEDFVNEANKKRPELANNKKIDEIKNDDYIDDIEKSVNNYLNEIDTIKPSVLVAVTAAGRNTNIFNKQQWLRLTNTILGIPLNQRNAWLNTHLKSFLRENSALITKLSTEVRENIESIILRGIKEGVRHETIAKQILNGTDLKKGVFNKTKTRAKLIARDQIAKLNGQLTELRQTEAGVSLYEWETAMDERVRGKPGGKYSKAIPTHWALHGKICKWSDSSVYKNSLTDEVWKSRNSIGAVTLHPGYDINCRCIALPVMESIIF